MPWEWGDFFSLASFFGPGWEIFGGREWNRIRCTPERRRAGKKVYSFWKSLYFFAKYRIDILFFLRFLLDNSCRICLLLRGCVFFVYVMYGIRHSRTCSSSHSSPLSHPSVFFFFFTAFLFVWNITLKKEKTVVKKLNKYVGYCSQKHRRRSECEPYSSK